MEFKFIDHLDALAFVRNDATDAKVIEQDKLLRLTLPLDTVRLVERGMKVVFTDANPDGTPWIRYFEVRNTSASSIFGTQEIEAEELLLAELTDSIMVSIAFTKANWLDVATEILSTTVWNVGDTLATLPATSISYDLYTIARPNQSYLDLRSAPRSTAKSLGKFNNGTLVKEVSNYNTDWKKVTVVGKTGYMYRSYLTYARTVTLSGLPPITINENYKDRYSLLSAVLDKVGLRAIPRLVRADGEIVRFVDFDLSEQDAYYGARIEIDRNAYADKIDYDDRGLYTRIYPTGKDGLTIAAVAWATGAGDPVNKFVGDIYLEDATASALYGRNGGPRSVYMEFTDAETASDLIDAAWAYLQTVNHPSVSVQLSAYDMAALGCGGRRRSLGEKVNVIIQPLGAQILANVVELTRDLLSPERTEITIGAYGRDVVSQTVSTAVAVEEVRDKVKSMPTTILDTVYPIGAIFLSVNSADPGTLFGGTWARIKDRFLLAAGDTYANGATGGAATHKHVGTSGRNSDGDRQGMIATNGSTTRSVDAYRTSIVDNSGSSAENITVPYTGDASSLPPYLAVYVWKRTA